MSFRIVRFVIVLLGVHLCSSGASGSRSIALAATFSVNTTSDDVDADLDDDACETVAGGGDCSLRAAVQQANATAGMDVIVVPDGIFSLITFGPDEDAAVTGDLDINESVMIRGAGADATIINGGRLDRVFDVDPARTGMVVEMRGLNVQGGSSDLGGGIRNGGTLTLIGLAIDDNSATADGGGVFSSGALSVIDSLVNGNEAASDGGGIHCGGVLTLTNCTVSGNTAGGSAGGIDSSGPLTMRFSTVTGNSAATSAGGVVNRTDGANTSVGSTIIAGNTAANCSQMLTTAGNNIEAANTCGFTAASDQHDTDPELCPLDNYGGTTHTHALPAASAARDAGAIANCPATDQRGLPRPVDGDGVGGAACDVGAFEAQQVGGGCDAFTPTPTSPRATPTATRSPTTFPGNSTPTPTLGAACVGDCNRSGNVTVDELVRGVNIALGRADLSTCSILDRDASDTVAVNELVAAVNNALRGCRV